MVRDTDQATSPLNEPLTTRVRAARAAFETGDQHPDFDTLAGLVDSTLEPAVLEAVLGHVEACPVCAEDVDDLRMTRDDLSRLAVPTAAAPATPARRPSRLSTWAAAAAMVLTVGGTTWWAWRSTNTTSPTPAPQVAQLPGEPTPTPAPVPVPMLRDADGAVQVSSAGEVSGLDRLAADESAALRDMLSSQRLPLPGLIAELRPKSGPLMGSRVDASAFRVLAPAGTVLDIDRPTFSWTALPRATAYRVSVFDRRLNPVAESGAITGLTWTPSKPLPRGEVLIWQVEGDTPDGSALTPSAGLPEARLSLLSARDAAALDAGRVRAGDSHLARALLFAKYGLTDQARRELDALAAANPGSPLVSALTTQLSGAGR